MKLVQILPGILVSFPLSFPFIVMISVLRDTQLFKKNAVFICECIRFR